MSKRIILPLHKSLLRPHLDYAISAWRHYQKDIALLEQVQHRSTKMVSGLRNITYEQRLKVLGLTTFETRMVRADLLQVVKILHNIDHVDKDKFLARDSIYAIARYMPSPVRLSVRLAVRLSVTRVDQSKTVQDRITQSSPQSSPMILVS